MPPLDDDILSRDAILREIVHRLADGISPERIYLFGSRARGDSGPDSDYDLFLVLSRMDEPNYRVVRRARRSIREVGTATDIVVCTRDEFEAKQHLLASLPATVSREGILLYAA